MKIHILRNVFVEPAIKDLEFSLDKKFKFEIFDYENYFDINKIQSDSLIIYIVDLERIKKESVFFSQIKKINKILIKKNVRIFILYYSKKNFLINQITSLNLANIVKKQKTNNPALIFDTNAFEKIRTIVSLIINANIDQNIRSIALDLDNTLWDGIIGEDKKVKLNLPQKENLKILKSLIDKGLIISIISKNNIQDIKKFKNKTFKYILNKSKKYINWNEKLLSLKQFIKWSKVNESNTVFVDDNDVELQKIKTNQKKVICIDSKQIHIFNFFLKVLDQRLKKNFISNKRMLDLKNNEKREELKKNNLKKFFQLIKPEVKFFKNNKKHIERLEEMSSKINQFNNTKQRLAKKDFEKLIKNKNMNVFTLSLKDKFGDSGVIGFLIFDISNKQHLKISDIKLSCRALGRNLEYFFIYTLIKKFFFNYKFLTIKFEKLDRNLPAQLLFKKYNLLRKKIKVKDLYRFTNEKEITTRFR